MKILHVIPSVSDVHGGPSIALKIMTRALTRAGVEVHVATTDDDGAAHLPVPLNTRVEYNDVRHFFFARQTQFYKFSLPLTRWLQHNASAYDVVHMHALFSYSTMPAAYFARRAQVPYIVRPLGTLNRYGMTQHHARIKKFSYPLVERRIIENAARMHYTSAQEKLEAEALGVTRASVVIPLGLDANAFLFGERVRATDEPVRILFLSRLDPKKGLERLLSAFAHVLTGHPRTVLMIAGEGEAEYVAALRQYAADLRVDHAVEWRGFVSGEAKRVLLAQADFFVLPSYSENFGISVAEALAAGLPVIVTPEIGIAQEIADARAGLIVQDEKTLAEAMNTLTRDAAMCAEIGARGRALAAEKFSADTMARALMDLYETVCTEART